MQLTDATDADFMFAQRVHHEAYRDMVLRQYGNWEEADQDDFFAATWERHPHCIIRDADLACGYCAIEHSPDAIVLREIAILPEFQGKGIGTRLLKSLLAEGRRLSIPVKLNVMKTNAAARRFYERLGFRPIGENGTHDLMSSEEV